MPILFERVTTGVSTPGFGIILVTCFSVSGASVVTPREAGVGVLGVFCGKSGVVLALGGAPVTGGAEGRGGIAPEGGFEMLGIGLVVAEDQDGKWLDAFIGNVVAAEMFGRGAGEILVEAGLRGRGGRLIRRVSRLGAFGSDGRGLAESAIIVLFYSFFGKCSMAKFAIVTYLWV